MLGQYDKLRTFVEARHQHAAVVTHGEDDERLLHVMLVEALLDNRRQELLKAFVHLPLSHRLMSATIQTPERPLPLASMRRSNPRPPAPPDRLLPHRESCLI